MMFYTRYLPPLSRLLDTNVFLKVMNFTSDREILNSISKMMMSFMLFLNCWKSYLMYFVAVPNVPNAWWNESIYMKLYSVRFLHVTFHKRRNIIFRNSFNVYISFGIKLTFANIYSLTFSAFFRKRLAVLWK